MSAHSQSSEDGRFIARGKETTRVWNSGAKSGHAQDMQASVVVSTDGKFIASGAGSNTIKFWNIKSRLSTEWGQTEIPREWIIRPHDKNMEQSRGKCTGRWL